MAELTLTVLKSEGAACCGSDCCQDAPTSTKNEAKMTRAEPIKLRERNSLPESTGAMKLSAFKALLEAHREKPFRLVLPNADAIPVSFHITEVAHVQKRFIDCGGKVHTTHTCQLQVWLGPDTDHRLIAGKMANVLNIANKVLPEGQDLDIEIEYEDTTISQYPVTSYTATEGDVTLHLGYKHTDCLAKDLCLPPSAGAAGCCGTTDSGCC